MYIYVCIYMYVYVYVKPKLFRQLKLLTLSQFIRYSLESGNKSVPVGQW